MKELIKKKYLCVVVGIFCMIFVLHPVKTNAMDLSKQKNMSVDWLKNRITHIDYEDKEEIRELCDALAVLRLEDVNASQEKLKEWIGTNEHYNIDELCRIAWATNDDKWREEIRSYQHEDGGFGLTLDYMSEPYDTMLAVFLEEYSRFISGEETVPEIMNIDDEVYFLKKNINEDGGIGYTVDDESRPGITAELGIAMIALGIREADIYDCFDEYLLKEYQGALTEDNFVEQTEILRYLLRRDLAGDVAQIEEQYAAVQSENGSVYDKITETIQYILLLRELEDYNKLKLETGKLSVECNTYVLEVGKNMSLSVNVGFSYTSNQDAPVIIRYSLYEDGETVAGKIVEKEIKRGEDSISVDTVSLEVTPERDKSYKLTVSVEQKDNTESGLPDIIAKKDISFTLHEDIVEKLILSAETIHGEAYRVLLSWNDISNENHRYRYRLFRKTDDKDWVTRSTWNGDEKVRVLNIYPCEDAKNYLVDWMNDTVEDSENPAGMGLFEIDTVLINKYNKDPEKYLLNDRGEYRYDVLMFGTADSNAGNDISGKAYDATLAFIDNGGGVLFGHDTIVYWMPNFKRFADAVGIKLQNGYTLRDSQWAKVVKEGFLTSYPWKLSGMLNVPSTHTQGQLSGGALSADVWMELQSGYDMDEETGGKTNAYLVSRNQLAMIQTGHSNGQATDDERKIIANTLFYLKQLTHDTSVEDKSFYDEKAPGVTDVRQDAESIRIEGQDYGTLYQYYVEAIGSKADDRHTSDTVSAEAISGLKGFIVGISDNDDPMPELTEKNEDGSFVNNMVMAADGSAEYELPKLLPEEVKHVHIYAVDNAGNVSEETVMTVTGQEKKAKQAYMHLPYTFIATDEDVTINCNSADITGDVYGNSTFAFQGTSLTLNGTASTSGRLSLSGAWFDIADRQEGVEAPDIPNYVDDILEDMEDEETEEITAYNSTEITVPTICKKTTGAWCPNVGIYASLVSNKSIKLNAEKVRAGADNKVVLCSREGDITVQATMLTGNGFIYAPNGTVTINVSELRYTGTIIAKKIRIQTGTCVITKEVE